MTPRRSLRARSRAIYADMTAKEALSAKADGAALRDDAPSLTVPGKRGSEQALQQPSTQREQDDVPPYVAPSAVAPDLMAQVRALYEESAVPVREIARRVGVTERTLYKYVERHRWRRRHACLARDAAVAAANRGRSVLPADGYRPAKGAGGRFIRREDAGKPHPHDLKALDPAGRADASDACAGAARLHKKARAKAEEHLRWEARERALAAATRMVRALNRSIAERKGRAMSLLDMRLECTHHKLIGAALRHLESLL